MSKKKEEYVSLELCTARHEAMMKELGRVSKELDDIRVALIGQDMQGGLVKSIKDVKNKVESLTHGSLSGKDKAAIIIAVAGAISAVIIALVK